MLDSSAAGAQCPVKRDRVWEALESRGRLVVEDQPARKRRTLPLILQPQRTSSSSWAAQLRKTATATAPADTGDAGDFHQQLAPATAVRAVGGPNARALGKSSILTVSTDTAGGRNAVVGKRAVLREMVRALSDEDLFTLAASMTSAAPTASATHMMSAAWSAASAPLATVLAARATPWTLPLGPPPS